MDNFLGMVGDLCLKDSHEEMNYSINPSFVSTKILSSDVRVVFVFILNCLSTRATATRLCPAAMQNLSFHNVHLKANNIKADVLTVSIYTCFVLLTFLFCTFGFC